MSGSLDIVSQVVGLGPFGDESVLRFDIMSRVVRLNVGPIGNDWVLKHHITSGRAKFA